MSHKEETPQLGTPTEMYLCEIESLVLHANQPYIFRKHESCIACRAYELLDTHTKPPTAPQLGTCPLCGSSDPSMHKSRKNGLSCLHSFHFPPRASAPPAVSESALEKEWMADGSTNSFKTWLISK